MTTHWLLKTQGEPLKAVESFLVRLFERGTLDAMLVPLRVEGEAGVTPCIVEDAARLAAADPFAPLMTANGASLAVAYCQAHPERRLGAVLRACEVRALLALAARGAADPGHLLIVGVDCLGTFPAGDVSWRGDLDALTGEALQFARQGGVAVYRYRPACQMCSAPMPEAADLTIDVLGLPARQHVMVTARSAALAERLALAAISDGPAPAALQRQHERMRGLVAGRRARARERILHALETELAGSVDALVEHLEGCAPCRACLAACPIYTAESAQQPEAALTRELVTRWLASCAGCGMCEASCPRHLPLVAIFRSLQEQIRLAMGNPHGEHVAAAMPPG